MRMGQFRNFAGSYSYVMREILAKFDFNANDYFSIFLHIMHNQYFPSDHKSTILRV